MNSACLSVSRYCRQHLMTLRFGMGFWAIRCTNCGQTFNHSLIDDSKLENFYFPAKPKVPDSERELECPNCGHKKRYSVVEFFYDR